MALRAIKVGDLMMSKMGHDIGRIYLVLKVENGFAFCADGDYRTVNNLKKKRIKHLRFLSESELVNEPTDTEIKRLIKLKKIELNKSL